ncbi:LCP family protein [Streptomyces sp. SP17BM10]|uniref:LCP family protein n=1 Tax=Streptomyces sp. SP17BM10 TaxID=3002530 RepID=UPI002E7A504E|nr:LCP family protein [Streptomyces sp. SP17BM10]MEE1782868.1 LCP family protein [Streptomyces sp. SP17BM10]
MTTSNAIAETKKDAPKHLDNSVNLLLIGLDSRKNMDGSDVDPAIVQNELHAGADSSIGGYNTNSLILLHIPAGGGKVQAVSIPRDDWVMTYGGDGSEMGMAKIKEAYGNAKDRFDKSAKAKGLKGADLEKAGRDAGRAATIRTVQKFVDQPVDHIAEVNLMGFYDIAKALEPIDVCLTHPVNDPIIARTPGHEGGGTGLKLPAGVSHLNAADALSFVRQRHNLNDGHGNSDDFARTHRQQAFISSVMHKLKQQGVIGDLGAMQKLFGVVQKDLVIDNEWNILDFAQQAPALTGGNVEFNTLTYDTGGKKGDPPQDVNLVTPAKIQKVVKQVFTGADAAAAVPAPGDTPTADATAAPTSPPTPTQAAAPATVDVFNASSAAGVSSSNEVKVLVGMGFKEGRTGPAATKPKTTTVTYGKGAKEAADQIAARYGVTAAESSSAGAGHVVVTLGTTFDGVASDRPATPTAGPTDPTANLPMQGPKVDAQSDGGIPCVF